MPEDEREFDCEDCGVHVISPGPRHGPANRCAGCQWLSEITVSPEERASLRRGMMERGIIGTA
jgi:hypothetical protein